MSALAERIAAFGWKFLAVDVSVFLVILVSLVSHGVRRGTPEEEECEVVADDSAMAQPEAGCIGTLKEKNIAEPHPLRQHEFAAEGHGIPGGLGCRGRHPDAVIVFRAGIPECGDGSYAVDGAARNCVRGHSGHLAVRHLQGPIR